uniref:Pre-mRNA 3'-end-processing factor FIP1 n=1 Tax=Sinocyclocheilus anshuiensis TaxID=1608454 RepID=A0A671NHP9_9TELE
IIENNVAHVISSSKSRGLDLDAEGNVLQVDVESFEEKPWRKPGADLSDYFNYGFNEDTWKAYCDKQRRLRMSLEILSLGVAPPFPSPSFLMSFLKSSGAINVIGGQAGTISRVEGRRRHSADENNIQVLFQSNPRTQSYLPQSCCPSFLPISHLHLSLLPPSAPHSPSYHHLVSELHICISICFLNNFVFFFPGVYTPVVGVASWSGVIDSSKAWENYTRHNKERVRERARERGHTKDQEREKERYRETDREHSPSTQDHRRAYKGDIHWGQSILYNHNIYRSCDLLLSVTLISGSSRRRHDSDDADSHRRHRHKRSKHNRGSLEPSEECNVDQENQSEATE